MSKSARPLAFAVAVIAWLALVAQYVLFVAVTWSDPGPWVATLRYFSFFTILSNVLVASTTALAAIGYGSRTGRFLADASVRGGVALCIGVTGLIYFFVLSSTWAPTGAQWLVDKALHYATPLSYFAWWTVGVEHGRLRWSDPLRWVLFPAAFLLWALLHGAWTHWYPYPFLDVDALGYANVLRNGVLIGGLFVALGLLVVALDRVLSRRVPVVPAVADDRAE
ncbi:Pr6Pr family membrane protein [Dokdonella sp.]|uniref:Pr6Pr family membrane protein n=1 Tax=Dokdonella sp. TaxID=2291710 RepID=UPI001B15FBE4|nr:Pr6Pr family membrane protein [Dokdonella sp.]MBO9663982.1 Pr6Pr family membrane protein [Dokdonella sp.]